MTDDNASGFQPLGAHEQPAPPSASTRRRSLKIPITITLGVVVVGLIVWGIVSHDIKSAALQPISAPPVATTALVYSGGVSPSDVAVRGVWGGAAIFELVYGGWSTLKAIDVDTGRTRWSLTQAAGTDIRYFDYFSFEGGKLTISIEVPASNPDTCDHDDTVILVLDITTGKVLSSRTFIEECGTLDDQPTWTSTSLLVAHNGRVVVDQMVYTRTSSYDTEQVGGTTLAYDLTDPDTTLWEVVADPDNVDYDLDSSQAWVLGAEWVFSAAGTYVSIEDGHSAASPPDLSLYEGRPQLHQIGETLVIVAAGNYYSDSLSMTGWADIDLTEQLWDYHTPAWWAIPQYYTGCFAADTYVFRIDSTNFSGDKPQLIAIDVTTGRQLWSVSDDIADFGENNHICTFIDDSHLLYISGTAGVVLDAATGAQISRTEGLIVTPGTLYDASIDPCGNLTCLMIPDYDSSQHEEVGVVTAVDFTSTHVQVHWTERFRLDILSKFPSIDDGRTVFIGKGDAGVYNITVV